ncbi:hybrid sensor histidine kinase/response regulator [Spiribacter halobius]|uniref:histidine kinase n=1 Tax=Sediminicurvatus halobius TaxID=2182432 RepID=A0A2U2N3M7_9GAMM|nr:PAS domain-containing sensor histidine kinase [Spiribacter halobius]PWG63682.1 hypothetical protein DEM34_07330 [Spiribacter halobius]UEX79820.1 PAS domain S-box protein [Spiribacter halobius]
MQSPLVPRPREPRLRRHTLVALVYLVAASAYILISGIGLAWRYEYDVIVLRAETLKGLGFVIVTSGLLWYGLKRAYHTRLFGERIFTTLVESLDDAVLVLRLPERVVVYANPEAERLFGYPESALAGADTRRLHVDEASFAQFQALSAGEVAAGRPYRGEFTMRARDGRVFPTEHLVSMFTVDGSERYAVSVVRDITERRRREEAVRESEARFRQLAENLREVFWISSPDKRVMEYVSPAFESIWGHPPQALYERPTLFLETIHPDDRPAVEAALPLQREGRYDIEYRIIRPDGATAWIWDRAVPIADDAGEVYRIVGVAEDITELKLAEQRFQQAQKMEAVGNLAGGIAHDFNNLLTIILGSLEALEDGGTALPERDAARIASARRAAERGADLTRRLLAFGRGHATVSVDVDVNRLIDDSHRILARTLGEDIELHIEPVRPPAWVSVDPTRLESGLLNLAVNARDAMPGGGGLTIRAVRERVDARQAESLGLAADAPYVVIEVTDTGTGMTPEVQSHAFEPFFTTKEAGRGSGLGLSTLYGFARQSGGTVTMASTPGQGTCFRLYLPEGEAPVPAAAEVGNPRAEPSADPLRGLQVLLVEDDDTVRQLVVDQLQALGCAVTAVDRGDAARERLEAGVPGFDVLISDVVMPGGLSGPELAREARQRWPALRVLLTSGYPDRASEAGADLPEGVAFLAKPFRAAQLAAALRALCGPPTD